MKPLESILIAVLGAVVLFNPTQASIGGSCKVPSASISGTCQNTTNTACCDGYYTSNYCPNDATAVKCCTSFEPCTGARGVCVDKRYVGCYTAFLNDKCPGSSNVKCCPGTAYFWDGTTTCKIGH
ncbi:hypothetical protein BKA62DRAFT_708890 [Auriculariales sp. MPI-PUGE-AT-0066]|nr:hypothetical protein BKA62DRAFT_708890 [Auriculariales sp. MPI-PUGE-AT-0066]